jgi:hypothetical protein
MRTITAGLMMVVAAAACTKRNPALPDAGLSARCESASDCVAPYDQCIEGRCGQCATSDSCPIEAPVCSGDHECVACTLDAQCGSGVCDDASGRCAAESAVVYVAKTGSAQGTCTRATPCVGVQQGIAATSVSRPWVLIGPGTYSELVSIQDKSVGLVGAGATMTDIAAPTQNAAVVTFKNAPAVTLRGLKVRGAFGTSSAHGVTCFAGSTDLTIEDAVIADNAMRGVSGCMVTMRRSTVSGNGDDGLYLGADSTIEESTIENNMGLGLHLVGGTLTLRRSVVRGNKGGGIDQLLGSIAIENTMIVGNGGASAAVGGVHINSPSKPPTLRFSTIAANDASISGVGVTCEGSSGSFAFDDDIVWGNKTDSGEMQVAGSSCTWTHSVIGPGTAVAGNVNTDPAFVDPTNGDYHIRVVSPAVDKADPSMAPAVDIDGDARPQGPAPDIGADEVKQ